MPSVPKSTKGLTTGMSKAKKQKRMETEEKLKGKIDNLKPSSHLNANQKKIFNDVVGELEASDILGNVDIYILDTFAIAVDRLRQIEKAINQDFQLLMDKSLMASKSKYTHDLIQCVNQLSLSPSSRGKFAHMTLKAEADAADPLLQVLNGGKKDSKNGSKPN